MTSTTYLPLDVAVKVCAAHLRSEDIVMQSLEMKESEYKEMARDILEDWGEFEVFLKGMPTGQIIKVKE